MAEKEEKEAIEVALRRNQAQLVELRAFNESLRREIEHAKRMKEQRRQERLVA